MKTMKISEADIQALKAQEAKDLCIDLLRKLNATKGGPISTGEVQLQELQYELKLKEAEAADRREQEQHEQRLAELQLEIEREKTRQLEAERNADGVRQEHVQIIQQVASSQEKLSAQLDRATREHNVHLQIMATEFQERQGQLQNEIQQSIERRDGLLQEISKLAELQTSVDNLDQLRKQIEDRRAASQRELLQLDEEIEQAHFEKTKQLNQIRRDQELAIAELDAQHRKQILQANLKSVDQILTSVQMVRVNREEWESLQRQVTENRQRSEQDLQELLERTRQEVRRSYNITSAEPFDVTDLFYRQRALQEDNESYRRHSAKLEQEIQRMREHIEKESSRIAAAIEAARVNIQNTIEPGVKR